MLPVDGVGEGDGEGDDEGSCGNVNESMPTTE